MMDDLLKRLEAATGPDRELDAAIFANLNPNCVRIGAENRFYDPSQISKLAAERYITKGVFVVPTYTASIDAALTLVPEGWLWEWGIDQIAVLTDPQTRRHEIGYHPLCALAICIAALKAKENSNGS